MTQVAQLKQQAVEAEESHKSLVTYLEDTVQRLQDSGRAATLERANTELSAELAKLRSERDDLVALQIDTAQCGTDYEKANAELVAEIEALKAERDAHTSAGNLNQMPCVVVAVVVADAVAVVVVVAVARFTLGHLFNRVLLSTYATHALPTCILSQQLSRLRCPRR